MSFEHYAKLWERVRNPEAGKPLANNTRLFKRAEDCFAIRLHETDVVTIFADGRTVLSTSGWYTPTTKDRITSYAPVRITSREGVWYVSHDVARKRAQKNGQPGQSVEVPYFDGIMFGPRGKVLNGVSPAEWQKFLRERRAMQKRIQTYCTGFNRALAAGMDMPSGGDCWYCCMFDAAGVADDNHLLHHMDERYYVPSLAVSALRAKKYPDVAVAMFLHMKPEQGTMGGEGFNLNDGSMGGNVVRRAIRSYLEDRLLPQPPNNDPQTANRPLRANRSTGLQTG